MNRIERAKELLSVVEKQMGATSVSIRYTVALGCALVYVLMDIAEMLRRLEAGYEVFEDDAIHYGVGDETLGDV